MKPEAINRPAPRAHTSWRHNPIVRLFSSVRLGISLLFLVLAFASVMSALPQVRGALEVTEMEAFSHWLFVTLTALMCLTITTATVVRIRWNLMNAGVLTVHAGILLLSGGALYYFGTKVEGDVPLRTAKLELVSTASGQRVIGQLPIEQGQTWSNTMPAFGGEVTMSVASVDKDASGQIQRVVVNSSMGENKRVVELTPSAPSTMIDGRLGVRFGVFAPESRFLDRERAAIYARPLGAEEWKETEIRGLPIHRERYIDRGYKLADSNGHPVPSKRITPHVNVLGIAVPTGWFEPWRMPLQVNVADAPFDLEITGYVPYVADMDTVAVPGGGDVNPSLQLRLSQRGGETLERTLFAMDPVRSFLPMTPPMEFRWVSSDAEIEALLTNMAGPHELTISVENPPVTKTIAIQEKQTIAVEGTPYSIVVQQFFPNWPMMSPGFEGAASPAALVEVTSDDKKFTRTVIQRFPQLSQDIDEKGMRKRDGPYDPNIQLRYRSAETGWMIAVTTPEMANRQEVLLAVFNPDGHVDRTMLRGGKAASLRVGGMNLDATAVQIVEHARRIEVPIIEPMDTRRPNVGVRSMSAIRLRFSERGNPNGWSEERWCSFSQYPNIDARSMAFTPPGGRETWEIVYSRLSHDLGVSLVPGKLAVKFFPGRRVAESWKSDFMVAPGDNEAPYAGTVSTNRTFTVGNWTLFQSSAATDHWSFTVLGVGSRQGIWPMVLGCVMITLGCLYAFYVKPVLRQRAIDRTLAAAALRTRSASAGIDPNTNGQPKEAQVGARS